MSKVLLVYEDYADLMNVEATLKRVGFDVLGVSSEYSMADQMLGFNPDVVVGSGRGGKVTTLGVGKRLKEMTRWQGKSILIFPANVKPAPADLIKIRVDMILEAPAPAMRLVQIIARLMGQDENAIMERLNKMSLDPQGRPIGTGGSGRLTPEEEAIFVKGSVGEGEEGAHVEEDSERRRVEFRFGERMQSAETETKGFSLSEEAFPDVDLGALERELTGGGEPEPEKIDTFVEEESLSPSSDEGNTAEEAQEELQKAEAGLKAKMARYAEMTKDVKVAPKSTITRVEARKRQKVLAADWDADNLNELDELRKEFTKALFKK